MNKFHKKFEVPIVIIPVKGGLGNQMFFYAFGLYMKANGIRPIFTWQEYILTKQHNGVELFDVFNIPIDNPSKRQISFFLKINKSFLSIVLKKILIHLFRSEYIFIRHFKQPSPYNFDNILKSIKVGKIYLDGFWQNYKYISLIRKEILETFSFNLPVNFSKNIFLKKILSSNSVSIHIRRKDYLDSSFKELNVIKSNDYYLRAIKLIEEKCVNPLFFIFTDDKVWAKQNFKSDKFIFVEGNDNEISYLDMYLMTKCKHNIIANSTFSWWGAWLNVNPKKIVIVPRMWTQKVFSSQLCPPDWLILEV